MEFRPSQPKWRLDGARIRRGCELDQFRPHVGQQRLRFIRAIGRLYRSLDRLQTVGKPPLFERLSRPRIEAARKPQLYPICSEIAAHCHPSL